MRRTWASLFAAGALVCGCGGAEQPRRRAPARATDPLVAMHADHAQGIDEVSEQFERGQGGLLPAASAFAPVTLRGRRVRAAQLPHFAGQPPRPLVEGIVLGVPRRARHPRAGLALLDWLTRPVAMPFLAGLRMAPPVTASYADPAMRRLVPAAGDLSVDQALRQLSRDIDATLAKRGATT